MMNDLSKTLITTMSAVVGGLGKAFHPQFLYIDLSKSLEVFFFACISALAGYIMKSLLDYLVKQYRKHRSNSKNHE